MYKSGPCSIAAALSTHNKVPINCTHRLLAILQRKYISLAAPSGSCSGEEPSLQQHSAGCLLQPPAPTYDTSPGATAVLTALDRMQRGSPSCLEQAAAAGLQASDLALERGQAQVCEHHEDAERRGGRHEQALPAAQPPAAPPAAAVAPAAPAAAALLVIPRGCRRFRAAREGALAAGPETRTQQNSVMGGTRTLCSFKSSQPRTPFSSYGIDTCFLGVASCLL